MTRPFFLNRMKYRVAGGFAVLLTLILTLLVLQIVAGDRLRSEGLAQADRITAINSANLCVMQDMTDAETGVRGFQLTGDEGLLEPYRSGRIGAIAALDRVAALNRDAEVRRLLVIERAAVVQWLYGYAVPIVNAGRADADPQRIAEGRELFDRIRTSNADVEAAIDTQRKAAAADATRAFRLVQLIFAGLALLILLTGLLLALLHQRHLLGPLEHIRLTLRRLTDGDLTARAVPAGPGELRAVMGKLNDLAAKTERLIAAEQARSAGSELVQAVATELKSERDPAETGRRIAALIGAAFGAGTVYGRVTVRRGLPVESAWPAGASGPGSDALRELRDVRPGRPVSVPGVAGALAVSVSGDAGCPPGVVMVVRAHRPEWSEEERRLLVAVADEIDHSVRQQRMRLRQARLISELRVLDEQKDAFVATVTHELRTPLTSILGYTEMLAEDDEELSPVHKRGLVAILRNAHRLEATVDDLLLLDRSNERLGAEAVPVDLAAVAATLHDDLVGAARAKDLSAELTAEPAWVRGDGAQLTRALRYLMENAIKFTPAGGRLECRLGTDGGRVVVTVTDTGIGIPPEDVPGLFTPFHRGANAMDQAVQGTGLGLAIVRTIVTEHGGTVAARSELGQGSTFTMTLPAIPASLR